jgi:hypothetical protein
MLDDKQIIKFKRLYENLFGEKINHEKTYEEGIKLLRLIELIYKPITKNEYEQLQKRRGETEDL